MREDDTLVALLALVPLIQLGLTFYLSVQVLCFGVFFVYLIATGGWPGLSISALFWILLLMFLPVAWVFNSPEFSHSLLRTAREFWCFLVLLMALQNAISAKRLYRLSALRIATTGIIVASLVFVVVQAYFILKGVLFFIPQDFYITNFNTLPNELSLRDLALPRPSGFFGEPSYMGFVGNSTLVIVLRTFRTGVAKAAAIVMIVATMIVCQTLAGLVSTVVLILFHWYTKRAVADRTLKAALVIAVLIFIVGLVGIEQVPVLGRLTRITDPSEEVSGYVRIMTPLRITGEVLATRPFGITAEETVKLFGEREEIYGDSEQATTDNAFLNMFINYGISALVILFALYRNTNDPLVLLYLLLATMFNGSFFSYDKVAIMGLVIILAARAKDSLQNDPSKPDAKRLERSRRF